MILALVFPALAREPATQAITPSIEFLDRTAASKAIVDESMEPYFKLLQHMEMSVKTGEPIGGGTLQEQQDRCRKRYAAAVEDFTEEEKQALTGYISQLAPAVSGDYPLYAGTPWSFIKLSNEFEGGMPHTRGGHIVVSKALLHRMVAEANVKPAVISLVRQAEVLLHEQSHVVQREHPEQFATLYTQFWGFKHAKSIQGCDWLKQHQLVNPDGVDVNWVFPIKNNGPTRWTWPLVVFGDVDDPAQASFADMRMVAIDLDPDGADSFKARVGADGKPVMQDLMTVGSYAAVFNSSQNIYHPNEAAADLFAKVVILDKFFAGEAAPDARTLLEKATPRLAPLNDWFKRILKAPRT